ncbi:MAG: phospho-sugar mutase, partial [Clostridia bacterium]|nr:phospho-sugar mutase [Clostridia bacterium]
NVKDVTVVAEQAYPDGNFTTCPYPNPEKSAALQLGLQYAQKAGSDLLLATDPDCDRVGIAVKTADGYKLMTGNEVGALLADYLLSARKADGTLPKSPLIVKTIVTTELAVKIAKEYGAEVLDVLTGFKYIGEIIGKLEKQGQTDRFVLGFEESYGYLSGAYVRDKDGVNGCMMIVEMAAFYKKQGKTLVDRIGELYEKYGLYEHKLLTYEFAGAEGNAEMRRRLEKFRAFLPEMFAKEAVVKTIDYLTQTEFDLPKSNVISLSLADGSKLIVRPSGTEPLVKVYLTVAKNKAENEKKLKLLENGADALFKA